MALRLAQGTRIAFHVGVVTSCLAIPLGAFLGLVAGYFGTRGLKNTNDYVLKQTSE